MPADVTAALLSAANSAWSVTGTVSAAIPSPAGLDFPQEKARSGSASAKICFFIVLLYGKRRCRCHAARLLIRARPHGGSIAGHAADVHGEGLFPIHLKVFAFKPGEEC